MNENIKALLLQCKVAEIPAYKSEETSIIIPKKCDGIGKSIKEGGCYLIELASYLTNPPDTYCLHQNWNNNIVPKSKYLKCECLKLMGSMIKINGIGYDYENSCDIEYMWSGWLPLKGIKILSEL